MTKVLLLGASGFVGRNLIKFNLESKTPLQIYGAEESAAFRLSQGSEILQFIKKKNITVVASCAWPLPRDYRDGRQNMETANETLKLFSTVSSVVEKFVTIGTFSEVRHDIENNNALDVSSYAMAKRYLTSQLMNTESNESAIVIRIGFPYGPLDKPYRLIPTLIENLLRKIDTPIRNAGALLPVIHIFDIVSKVHQVLFNTHDYGPKIVNHFGEEEFSVDEIKQLTTETLSDLKSYPNRFRRLMYCDSKPESFITLKSGLADLFIRELSNED